MGLERSDLSQWKPQMPHGWGTWAVDSVVTYTYLPDGVGIRVGLKELTDGKALSSALIGRRTEGSESVRVGPRSYDGTYTEVEVAWEGIRVRVETAASGESLLVLVTPLENPVKVGVLKVESVLLWGREGGVELLDGKIKLQGRTCRHVITGSGERLEDPYLYATGPAIAFQLTSPVILSTGVPPSLADTRAILDRARDGVLSRWASLEEDSELAEAMHTCLAWDTVYDPKHDRLISPVSRLWCLNHGGYVLFCWDTFFAAWMALPEAPELAQWNAIGILQEATPHGFIPNYAYATGQRSLDRSQPQVGSMVVREIYKATHDRDFLAACFQPLLRWNRWWEKARLWDGKVCPGSNSYLPLHGNFWEFEGVGGRFGAALETGLDNSPMYDDIPFDQDRELLCLADVGLTALYAADCQVLEEVAYELGQVSEAEELAARGSQVQAALRDLWCEERGMFLNRRMDTGAWDDRVSPTNFYPLLSGTPTPDQARRMIHEHLLNPDEFWGGVVLPSISRKDPAFPEQEYWRGRVWAPMNFLVYLGLLRYDTTVASELAALSAKLLLQEWREDRHIHENYHAETGDGDDVSSSDAFYHWGGLLALMKLMDSGHVPQPNWKSVEHHAKS